MKRSALTFLISRNSPSKISSNSVLRTLSFLVVVIALVVLKGFACVNDVEPPPPPTSTPTFTPTPTASVSATPTPTIPQGPFDGAFLVWQGFHQQWTYNHRLNRLGDWISNQQWQEGAGYDSLKGIIQHSAASGSGEDIATFESLFTAVAFQNLGAISGSSQLTLQGMEGEQISLLKKVSVTLPQQLQNKSAYSLLLQGFDMCATDSADKIWKFSLSFADESHDTASHTYSFTIQVILLVDCKSLECPWFDNTVDYELRVDWLLIGGDSGHFKWSEHQFTEHYTWDTETEIFLEPRAEEISDGDAPFPYATLGIRSISFALDRDHWMLGWVSAARPKSWLYHTTSATFQFDLELLFKQWTVPMHPLSQRVAGEATLSLGVALLQFKQANIRTESIDGSIAWPGGGGGACVQEAVSETEVQYDYPS